MSLRSSRGLAVGLVTFATFTDIVAYSVAVPVLPDLGRRLGASPTMIGLLFASFGVTLLTVSIPMGAISDRVGRKGPLVWGLVALAASTVLFAFADSLPWLFAARLVQGAADAVTWVVGFALIADLYGPTERGRMTGIVMSGTSMAFMVGPSIGGWLYEAGGMRLPFLAVALLAVCAAAGCLWFEPPRGRVEQEAVSIATVLREPSVAACALLVVAIASTLSMIEPNFALHLQSDLLLGPARVGLVFAAAAVGNTIFHPIFGRLADRFGARRMTLVGLVLTACALPLLGRAWSFESAVGLTVLQSGALAVAITPSLAYMGEAASKAGVGSFGVSYGIYNMAWAVGLLGGPAVGGFLFERIGFARLTLAWAPVLVLVTWLLGRVQFQRSSPKELV
jgi:MFS transporter, DHA1 family, solute carrier family 18 (vesicular amine transporter), member 1/2